MGKILAFTQKYEAALWNLFFSFALGLNIINYRAIDTVFVFIFLVGLTLGIRDLRQNFFLQKSSLNFLVLGFVVSCSLGYFIGGFIDAEGWTEIFELRWVLGFYCTYLVGRRIALKKSCLKPSAIAVAASLLYILYIQYRTSYDGVITFIQRLQGFYVHPNHLGLTLVLLWSFYLGFLLVPTTSQYWLRILQFTTFLIISVCLFGTYSRTAWMAAATTLILGLIYSKNRIGILLSSLAGAAFMFLFFTNKFTLKDRLLYSLDISATGSQGSRFLVWKVNWQIFLEHPLFGVGIEAARRNHYPAYYDKLNISQDLMVGNAHNQYLQILSGAGFFGLAFFLGIFVLGLRYFHIKFHSTTENRIRQTALAGILVIAALLLSSFTDSPFRIHECRNYLLLLLGLIFGFLYNSTAGSAPFENKSS